MINRHHKFLKTRKSELFKYLKDIHISSKTDKADEYIFRLDSLNFYLYCFNENHKNLLNIKPLKHKVHNKIKYSIIKEQFTETLFFVCNDIVILYIKENDFEDFYLSFVNSQFKMIIYKTELYYIIFCVSHTSKEINDIKSFLLYNNNDIRYIILSHFINNNDLENSDLENSDLENNDIENNDIENNYLENSDLENSDIENSDIENSDIENSDIENSDLENNDIENSDLEIITKVVYPQNLEYNGIIPLNIDYMSLRINCIKKYSLKFHSIIGYGKEQKELVEIINIILQYIKNNTYLPCHYLYIY